MEALDISSSKLPPPYVLFGPAAFLGSLPPQPAHPNVRKLHAAAMKLIKLLEPIAKSIRVEGLKVTVTETDDPSSNEPARALLESARHTVAVLTGTQAKIFERDLSRFAGHLAPQYFKVKEKAVAKLNELRAVIAFFLGETDDGHLGYQFVPAPPPIGEPSPSVSVDLS